MSVLQSVEDTDDINDLITIYNTIDTASINGLGPNKLKVYNTLKMEVDAMPNEDGEVLKKRYIDAIKFNNVLYMRIMEVKVQKIDEISKSSCIIS